jgi:DNA-directed RNA polymerase subunit RPC12/RpoP
MVKCPYCGFEGDLNPLKTWKYVLWDVYFYECPSCKGRFRYQVDPTGRRGSYVIRVGVKRK